MASDGNEMRVSASPDSCGAFGEPWPGPDQTPASPSGGEAAAMTSEDSEFSGGCDLMVKIELDAALVLAEFQQLALMACRGPDSQRGESERKWGGRGRRSRTQRPRSAEVWRRSFQDFEKSTSSGDAQDLLSNKQDLQNPKSWRFTVKKNIKIGQYVKVEEHVEFTNEQDLCKKVMGQKPSSRGKPKQYLTEAEKEERRLRRIQANRESARQTIRRRQAFCEELKKKAGDLLLENKSIKQEIKSAMQEYLLLLERNKHLKEQMAEVDSNVSPSQDIKETPLEDPTCKAGHLMSSAIQFPLVVHSGTTSAQFARASFMRPSDPGRPPVVCSELNPLTACISSLPNERWTFGGCSRLRTQLLVLPCPSTYSVNNQLSRLMPSTSLSSNSSDGRPDGFPHETDLTLKLAGDAGPKALHCEPSVCSSTVNTTKIENKGGLTETSNSTLMDGRSGMSSFCVEDPTFMPTLGTDMSSIFNHKHFLLADSSYMTTCLVSRQSIGVLDKDLRHSKRFSDVAAATEARKRRKALTKLKHLHGRQLKLHC